VIGSSDGNDIDSGAKDDGSDYSNSDGSSDGDS
jgi:hypothetical protein